jgi:hypothetical protein
MYRSLAIVAALSILGSSAENVNYDAVRQGQLPKGWSAPAASEWEIRSDKTAPSRPNVLQGAANSSNDTVPPLALFDKVVCVDGDLSVKFRIETGARGGNAAGRGGNAAGLVWRYRDAGNYYLLTFSADEKNIVLRRVQNGISEVVQTTGGKRATVGVAEDIRAGQWHVVKVAFRGHKVQVFFGNRSIFTAEDSGIAGPGKTGVWAKGANGAAFDDFRIEKKG